MRGATRRPVVVGVDETSLSLSAARLAAREALAHRQPLRIVHAFNFVADPDVPLDRELRDPAQALIERAATAAAGVAPGIELTCALLEGPALTMLLRESGNATLVVVGDGGLATHTCVPVDALAVQVAARSGCSVLVAREMAPPSGPVLVGVDGGPGAPGTLAFAFDAAGRRDAELVVLRVWEDELTGDISTDLTARLAETVEPWRSRYPSVRVRPLVRAGDVKEIMVAESRRAQLVVVGMRGEQSWRGMLGALSQAVLYHSPAPVAIVRGPHELYVQA